MEQLKKKAQSIQLIVDEIVESLVKNRYEDVFTWLTLLFLTCSPTIKRRFEKLITQIEAEIQ